MTVSTDQARCDKAGPRISDCLLSTVYLVLVPPNLQRFDKAATIHDSESGHDSESSVNNVSGYLWYHIQFISGRADAEKMFKKDPLQDQKKLIESEFECEESPLTDLDDKQPVSPPNKCRRKPEIKVVVVHNIPLCSLPGSLRCDTVPLKLCTPRLACLLSLLLLSRSSSPALILVCPPPVSLLLPPSRLVSPPLA